MQKIKSVLVGNVRSINRQLESLSPQATFSIGDVDVDAHAGDLLVTVSLVDAVVSFLPAEKFKISRFEYYQQGAMKKKVAGIDTLFVKTCVVRNKIFYVVCHYSEKAIAEMDKEIEAKSPAKNLEPVVVKPEPVVVKPEPVVSIKVEETDAPDIFLEPTSGPRGDTFSGTGSVELGDDDQKKNKKNKRKR